MSLKKIAKMVGVSTSTVSRVLNNTSYKCATQETKDKIWAAAKDINYVPNLEARNLKMGASTFKPKYKLSILLARYDALETDPFFFELFRSIEEELLKNNCILDRILTIQNLDESFSHFSSDGIIVLGRCPYSLLSKVKSQFINIIGIGRNPTNFDMDEIICNGKNAAIMAIEYLITRGHKKIAYIGDCSYESRYIGYTETLLKHHLPLDFSYIKQTHQTEADGYDAMSSIISDNIPEAVFCANDITAIGAIHACHDKHLAEALPAIISIDNIEACQLISPSLTTVNIPKNEMGKFAVKLLIDRIQKGHFENVRLELPCKLVIRESC